MSPQITEVPASSSKRKKRSRNSESHSQDTNSSQLDRRQSTLSDLSDAEHHKASSNPPSMFASSSGKPVTLTSSGLAAVSATMQNESPAAKPCSSMKSSHLKSQGKALVSAEVSDRQEMPGTSNSPPADSFPLFVTFSASGKQKEWKISEKALEDAKAKLGLLDADDEAPVRRNSTSLPSVERQPSESALEPPKQKHRAEPPQPHKPGARVFNSPAQQKVHSTTAPTKDISVSQRNAKTTTRALLGVSDLTDTSQQVSPGHLHSVVRPSFRAPALLGTPSSASSTKVTPNRGGFTTPMTRGSFNTPRVSTTPNEGGNLAPPDSVSSGRCGSSKPTLNVSPRSIVTKLTPICITSDFSGVEIRCPLRKILPSMQAVFQGSYHFPTSLCCPRMVQLFLPTPTDAVIHEEHFRSALKTLGARNEAIPLEWIQSMLRNVLRKLLSFETSDVSNASVTVFSPFYALAELLHRYNREYVDGHRSILRRIAEKDSQSTTLMVLCVSNTTLQERPGPHQTTIEVTDGWYFARCNLDLPLSQFVQDGLISVGDKIVVWGAASCRDDACSPLELLNSHGALLNLFFNGTKQAAANAPLGALPPNTAMPVSIHQIHAHGGAVPCISGIVTRLLPKFYIDRAPLPVVVGTTPARGSGGGSGNKVVRNAIAESKFAGSFESRREIAYEQAISQGMSSDAAAVLMRDQFAREVSEVSTIILETGEPGEIVAIQRTTRCGGAASHGDTDESSLPREGQRIHMFGVIPSKASTAPPPLSVKLLYVRSQFMFVVDRNQPDGSPTAARDDKRSSPSFQFNVEVQQSLSSLSNKRFGQMVDAIVICVGSQTQPTANGETSFFFCGIERNVFGVLVARSFPGARELELAQPTPGTACLVRNATFACYDESKEYNVLRLHANEYTVISTRTMSMDLQQRMKELESRRLEWKPTFDLGKQLLADSGSSTSSFVRDALGGSSANRSTVSVHEVVTYVGNDEFHGEGHRAVSAPYYLRNSQLPKQSTPVNFSSGVKLAIAESPAASSSSIVRPLFDSSSIKSTSPILGGKLNISDQSEISPIALETSPPHRVSHCDAATLPRHVFGNLTVETFSLHFDGGHCIDLHTSMGCTLASITHEFSQHNTQWKCEGLELSFLSHLGPRIIRLSPLFVATLGDHISLTPQQLSALSSDDSIAHFSVGRSLLLSTASNLVEAWEILFCRSVVVPPAVMAAVAPPLSIDQENIDGAVVASLVQCDKDDGVCRWNRSLVPDAADVLWWTEQEWRQMKSELQEAFASKLFKLSLGLDGRSVEKMFFLKDNCSISELMAE
jgi:hypothetical protein